MQSLNGHVVKQILLLVKPSAKEYTLKRNWHTVATLAIIIGMKVPWLAQLRGNVNIFVFFGFCKLYK